MVSGARRLIVAGVVTVSLLLAGCGSTERPRIAVGPPPPKPEWALEDTLKIYYLAILELKAERQITPRFRAMIDAAAAGEVKASILLSTQHYVNVGLGRLATDPVSPPVLARAGFVAADEDCVVGRVVIDYTPTRPDREQVLDPKLATFYGVFRRLPNHPDPLNLNPVGWRWEQLIRQEVPIDSKMQKLQKQLRGEPVDELQDHPYNACHATAGLADNCDPPAPNPPFGEENNLGRALLGIVHCPPKPGLGEPMDRLDVLEAPEY